jgi:predicted nucleic acid-binding protein
MKTFVDTGGWIAVVVQTDQYHDVGVLHYEALISRRERFFQDFSFTDCTSFVLVQQAEVDEVFGFDQHFLMFGFNVKPLW